MPPRIEKPPKDFWPLLRFWTPLRIFGPHKIWDPKCTKIKLFWKKKKFSWGLEHWIHSQMNSSLSKQKKSKALSPKISFLIEFQIEISFLLGLVAEAHVSRLGNTFFCSVINIYCKLFRPLKYTWSVNHLVLYQLQQKLLLLERSLSRSRLYSLIY